MNDLRNDDLRSARCLVLGAGGFIGTNTCHALMARGAQVEGFGRPPTHSGLLSMPWRDADFADADALAAAVAGQDFVIHLVGGRVPVLSNDDPVRDVEDNLLPSLRLIDLCRKANVRRLLFASSGGTVYGVTGPSPITEDHPTDPITAYGVNKLAAEKYLGLARRLHGFDAIALRIANPYGPFQFAHRPQGIVGALIARALAGETVEIWGDGSVVRDFLHVRDVAEAIVASLCYHGPEWVFNVGSGQGRSLREVVEAVARVADLPPERIRYLPARPADVPVNILDVTRISLAMGWRPTIGWEDGLAETAAWMRRARAAGAAA